MASQAKRKKDDDDDGENVSRTGRQRKKSAKVLEMEAEAEELALVLRARVETPTTPRFRPTIPKGPRVKKTPAKTELAASAEEDMDDMDDEEDISPSAVADAQSKSGRVRKKSAKLMEMVEAEELDRKIFRTSHIPKSFRTAVNPSPAMPAKKGKLKIPTATATSPVRSAESTSGSPPGLSPSAIKLLLSSPSKKTPGAAATQPEPILSMLGASLASPTKAVPQPKLVAQTTAGTVVPEGTDLGALATAAALASPNSDKDFEVKFLQDCPDAVVNTKPVAKKRSKKQAMPTPSAPALEKPAVISPGSSPKSMPKLKNLLSPTKKLPTMATSMADQPLLSKMMGEVGQIGPPPPSSAEAKKKKLLGVMGGLGPPPPSSAEAKNMKKRAKKEAAAALKNQTEGVLKKFSPTQIPTTVRHFAMPKATVSFGMPQLQPAMGLPMLSPFDDDSNPEDDEQDQLMIDTTKSPKKKKAVKKEKLIKPKPVMVEQVPPELELVIPPRVEVEQEVGMLVEEVVGPPDEEDEDFDNELVDDEEDDDDGEEVDVEVPSYANTNFMATKVQTSHEKKASKDKKKKKGKKDDPEKQKKKRGPTAYMLWCNAHRAKLVKDNPGIDFATISRRLGEMWSGQTEKDKMTWKKKAKKLASKGSTIISTGKGVSQMVHGGSGATLLNKPAAHAKGAKAGGSTVSPQVSRAIAAATAATQQQQQARAEQEPSPLKSSGCTPLDIAAHLKLLGESLSIIGARLQEHHGQIAVQGTLPVLLDSLLCALGPLACLTTNVPQLDGAPLQTHASTLDHIAYIMPGIG